MRSDCIYMCGDTERGGVIKVEEKANLDILDKDELSEGEVNEELRKLFHPVEETLAPEVKPEPEAVVESDEDEPEEIVDEDDEPEEVETKTRPIPTKEQRAIIEQKRLNQVLRKELDALMKEKQEREATVLAKKDAQKYIDAGWDEEAAIERATSERMNAATEARLKAMEFRIANAKTFERYPVADAAKVMKLVEDTGRSADAVCGLLYADDNPTHTRATQSAKADAKKRISATTGAGVATEPTRTVGITLTARQERERQYLSKIKGEQVSAKEYLEL